MLRFVICLVLVFVGAMATVRAQEQPLPEGDEAFWEFLDYSATQRSTKTLWVEGSRESTDGQDYYAEFDLALASGYWFMIGAGKSRIPLDEGTFEPDRYFVGGSTRRFSATRLDFSYLYWGESRQLVTQTFTVGADWWGKNWSVRGGPQFRAIDLFTRPREDGSQRELNVSSRALEAWVGFHGLRKWEFIVGAARYRYSRDLTPLSRPIVSRAFSAQALTLAYSFLDRWGSLEAAYRIGNTRLSLKGIRTRSAIDFTDTNVATFTVGWFGHRNFFVSGEAGRVAPEFGELSTYATLRLGYSWQ